VPLGRVHQPKIPVSSARREGDHQSRRNNPEGPARVNAHHLAVSWY